MPNIFSLIGNAWEFYRKQPVLNSVLLWLMALPTAGIMALGQLQEKHDAFHTLQEMSHKQTLLVLLVIFALLVLKIITLWGVACVLIVAKKIVGNSAGRTRSSFRTVRQDAAHVVTNLFITEILRGCLAILWGLLFIIPGIVYLVRTVFFQIAIVCEGAEYRKALKQSSDVVKGQTFTVLLYIVGLGIAIFIPIGLIAGFCIGIINEFDMRLLVPIDIIVGGLSSLGTLIYILALTMLYSHVKNSPKTPTIRSVTL